MRLRYLLSLQFWFRRNLYVIEINAHVGFGSVDSAGRVGRRLVKKIQISPNRIMVVIINNNNI